MHLSIAQVFYHWTCSKILLYRYVTNLIQDSQMKALLVDCPNLSVITGLMGSVNLQTITIKSDALTSIDFTNQHSLVEVTLKGKNLVTVASLDSAQDLEIMDIESGIKHEEITIRRAVLQELRLVNPNLRILNIQSCPKLFRLELDCPK